MYIGEKRNRESFSESTSVDAYATTPVSGAMPHCGAQDCTRPVDGHNGGPWCTAHRRGLTLTTGLTDLLGSFLNPGGTKAISDHRVIEAGELSSMGLELLLSHAFNSEVIMKDESIVFSPNADNAIGRWRVWFRWAAQDDA